MVVPAPIFQFGAAEAAGVGGQPPDARSLQLDIRICTHESAHAVAARLLNLELGGATVDASHGFAGMTFGPRFISALAQTDDSSLAFSDKVRAYMPQPGEDRDETAILLLHTFHHIIELVAGSVGEEMLLPGAPMLAGDDLRQEVIYASLFTNSPEACEAFIGLARTMARDLLTPHKEVIRALADALQVKRTMTGQEIDIEIASALARQSLAAEHARRAAWRQIEQNAASFRELAADMFSSAKSVPTPTHKLAPIDSPAGCVAHLPDGRICRSTTARSRHCRPKGAA
jgi:hypothetical protein